MNNYGAEIKVGLFVLIGIIILSYMSLKVGKFDFGKKKATALTHTLTMYPALTGMSPWRLRELK